MSIGSKYQEKSMGCISQAEITEPTVPFAIKVLEKIRDTEQYASYIVGEMEQKLRAISIPEDEPANKSMEKDTK